MLSLQSIFGKKVHVGSPAPMPVIQEPPTQPDNSARLRFEGRFDQLDEALGQIAQRQTELAGVMRLVIKEMMVMREQMETLKQAQVVSAPEPEPLIELAGPLVAPPAIDEGWMTSFQFLKSVRYPAKSGNVRSISQLAWNMALVEGVTPKTHYVTVGERGRVARSAGEHKVFPIHILRRALAVRFPSAAAA
jgi:hypothetical protein